MAVGKSELDPRPRIPLTGGGVITSTERRFAEEEAVELRVVLSYLREGSSTKDEFPIASLVELTLGRDPSCQIRCDDRDETASRRHARVSVGRRDPLEIVLTDLASRNGTFVNGQRIQGQVKLTSGDRIQLGTGGPVYQFEIAGQSETKVVTPTARIMDVPAATVVVPVPPPPPQAVAPQQIFDVPAPPRAAAPAGGSALVTRRALMYSGLGLMAGGAAALGGYALLRGRGSLSYKVYHQRMVMSCAYKAYGNPEAVGGRYWFARTVLQNTGKSVVKNVHVSYQIPGFMNWTTPDEAAEILPNQTVVFVYYPKFPSKLTELRSRTPAVLEVKIEYDDGSGHQEHIEKREFEFFGVNEFAYGSMAASEVVTRADAENNNPLLAAYVTDEDQAVKTFYAKAAEVSGGFGTGANQKDLLQFMKSVYNFMVSLGMTYSGAKGVPDETGDVRTLVQSIRLPRDLIYGNSGLCIELAILWCALGQGAGLKTFLVLIPGHAFPVLQASDGTTIPIESTAIGGSFGGNLGKAAGWDEAIESALKTFKENKGKPTTDILDIRELQGMGIRPPELPEINRAELVKLLDDRRTKHSPRVVVAPPRQQPVVYRWWWRRR
jgi:hypothetical protein